MSWAIVDADGSVLNRFATEDEAHEELLTDEYPDDVEVAFINEPETPYLHTCRHCGVELRPSLVIGWVDRAGSHTCPMSIPNCPGCSSGEARHPHIPENLLSNAMSEDLPDD